MFLLQNIGAKHDGTLLYLRLFFSPLNYMRPYKEAIQSGLGPTLPTLGMFASQAPSSKFNYVALQCFLSEMSSASVAARNM